jgi:hypothetical protein
MLIIFFGVVIHGLLCPLEAAEANPLTYAKWGHAPIKRIKCPPGQKLLPPGAIDEAAAAEKVRVEEDKITTAEGAAKSGSVPDTLVEPPTTANTSSANFTDTEDITIAGFTIRLSKGELQSALKAARGNVSKAVNLLSDELELNVTIDGANVSEWHKPGVKAEAELELGSRLNDILNILPTATNASLGLDITYGNALKSRSNSLSGLTANPGRLGAEVKQQVVCYLLSLLSV